MRDLVEKYQHYFTESVRLQEVVNEQLAYIQELEEALLYLHEKSTEDTRGPLTKILNAVGLRSLAQNRVGAAKAGRSKEANLARMARADKDLG